MRAFHLRSGDGEEKAGGACVVEGRCEDFKSAGEGEGLGASGGEEAASDAWRSSTEGDGARCEVPVNQSKAAVISGGKRRQAEWRDFKGDWWFSTTTIVR
jgi:hypothetical protein